MAEQQGNQSAQIDMAQLEAYTNQAPEFADLGGQVHEAQPEPERQEVVVEQSQAQESVQTPEPQNTNSAPEQGQAQIPPELQQALSETPFKGEDVVKSVSELVKGYKELQRWQTETSTKVKPYKQLLEMSETRPDVAQALKLVEQVALNPQMLQAYNQQQSVDAIPDPANYDIYSPEGKKQYDADLSNYMARQVDARINSHLQGIQTQQMQERQKYEFKQRFPDVNEDLDSMLQETMTQIQYQRVNPYELAWKLRNWDSREAQLTERLKKSLTEKMETASNNKTPSAPSSAQPQTKPDDVMRYITKYGYANANKKYGEQVVRSVLEASV